MVSTKEIKKIIRTLLANSRKETKLNKFNIIHNAIKEYAGEDQASRIMASSKYNSVCISCLHRSNTKADEYYNARYEIGEWFRFIDDIIKPIPLVPKIAGNNGDHVIVDVIDTADIVSKHQIVKGKSGKYIVFRVSKSRYFVHTSIMVNMETMEYYSVYHVDSSGIDSNCFISSPHQTISRKSIEGFLVRNQ